MPTKNVFVTAMRFAMSIDSPPCPPFGDEVRRSAQEQVEYMLDGYGKDMSFLTLDDEVKLQIREGLSKMCSSFEEELSSLLLQHSDENKIMQHVHDLDWMCNVLPKINLMNDFVTNWVDLSVKVLNLFDDIKLDGVMLGLKVKLIEVTNKVLEAVGYGTVIVPAHIRLYLVKTWLPFIRKMKSLLDLKKNEDAVFPYNMDEDLCQSIEGAITSLILALPSNDQAEIFLDWMNNGHMMYPDLSEAFELWCYRTKSANRRILAGVDRFNNHNLPPHVEA